MARRMFQATCEMAEFSRAMTQADSIFGVLLVEFVGTAGRTEPQAGKHAV